MTTTPTISMADVNMRSCDLQTDKQSEIIQNNASILCNKQQILTNNNHLNNIHQLQVSKYKVSNANSMVKTFHPYMRPANTDMGQNAKMDNCEKTSSLSTAFFQAYLDKEENCTTTTSDRPLSAADHVATNVPVNIIPITKIPTTTIAIEPASTLTITTESQTATLPTLPTAKKCQHTCKGM